MNGCHAASGARIDVAGPSRDRVTIDLRGIGEAVRAAAACRGMGVAQLVRRAVVMSLDLHAPATVAPVRRSVVTSSSASSAVAGVML